METINSAYRMLLWISAVFLSLSICACIARGILGPRFTDRIISVNIICTKVIILIAVLSCLLRESSLLDIAVVYAMISFLAVVTLSKCYYISQRRANPAAPDYNHEPRIIRENKGAAK